MSSTTSGRGTRAARTVALLAVLAAGVLAGQRAATTLTAPPAAPGAARGGQAGAGGASRIETAKADADGWHLAVSRHYGRPGNASGYSAIVATGASSVWAFGGVNPGGVSQPTALHLTGGRWRNSRLPGHLGDFIEAASATSASDIWAVSYNGGYVLHFNGHRWTVAKRWTHRPADLTGVTALSPRNCWVFGTTTAGQRGLGTWHFSGRHWHRVGGLGGDVSRASAISSRDIWAVGATPGHGFIEHYNGRAWERVGAGGKLNGATLDSVLALGPRNVWVAGTARHGDGRLILAHLDGTRWTRFTTQFRASVGRLARDGAGGIWVTADQGTTALAGHLPRGGKLNWTVLHHGLGAGATGITSSTATGAAWISGDYLTRRGGDAAVWARPASRAGLDLPGAYAAPMDRRSRRLGQTPAA